MNQIDGVELISCGGLILYWLNPHQPISDDALQRVVHSEEWDRSVQMGASMRRFEFLRARYLLRRLTGYTKSLLVDDRGAPKWPSEWSACISHKKGHVVVAYARRESLASFGIDMELCEPHHTRMVHRILSLSEQKLLRDLEGTVSYEDLVVTAFSFKESLFKCVYQIGLRMFYFLDVEIETFDLKSQKITARLKVDASPSTPAGFLLEGSFVFPQTTLGKFVMTTVSLPHLSGAT